MNSKRQTSSERVKSARSVLRPVVRDFFDHSLFSELRQTPIDQAILRQMAVQYWHLSRGFPAILGFALGAFDTDRARWPIVKNLWDEHGEADMERGHRMMYRDFMRAVSDSLSENYEDLISSTMNVHTSVYLAGMKHLTGNSSKSRVAGQLAFFEAIAPKQCTIIAKALSEFDPALFGKDMPGVLFWADHAEHDPTHIREILSICDAVDDFRVSDFEFGVKESMVLEQVFWSGVKAISSAQTK